MKCYCSLSSLSVLLVSFLYHDTCASIPFSVNPLFLIYSSLPHISTFHLYLTNLPSWHFVSFASEECGRRSLLSYYLHCSGYFLINATDKVVAHHLMQRQKVTPNWKFPLWSLILSLQILLPTWSASESFDSPLALLGRSSSSGPWHPHTNTATLQLHPQSSGTYNNFFFIIIVISPRS